MPETSPIERLRALGTWERVWLGVRVALIGYFVVAGATQAGSERTAHLTELLAEMPAVLPMNLLTAPIVLAFVVGVQSISPFSAEVWHPPSWARCPIDPRQPLQFFHAVSFALVGYGLAMAGAVWAPSSRVHLATYVALTGVGVWLGTWLCVRLFAWKTKPRPGWD